MSWRPITLVAALCLALTVPGTAAADDPPPEVEQRTGTRAPAEVHGLSEPAQAGDPVAAAKAHLAEPRYHLDPADLAPLRTVVDGADETVRFAQRHRGVPVFGAHYLVHFRKDGDRREVVGAGGRFLTELTVSTTPTVTGKTAARIAHTTMIRDHRSREGATAQAAGLVVVPSGAGQLAWHVVLTGRDAVAKKPLLLDAYVDAHSGRPLFAVDRLRMEGPVTGSGQTSHGRTVELNAYERADGAYELRDRTRPMWDGTDGEILTYDAAGRTFFDFFTPGIPEGTELVRSATPAFGPEHTETGAVDAHWSAGQVYAYYRGLGRDGLDGQGGTMYSVVNVTADGEPYTNAFWDGTKMVYGGGGDYHSFAAALDVVGHEMTHGVITHSADLVYLGQSGAINEGLADYFGNAIQVDTYGIPMSDPNASLLGETLCKTAPPEECAGRDLDDGRVAGEDYLGFAVGYDNGGVHYNSTIFSGALWDVREALGGAVADRLVYKALTEYMTPLDDFVDGRRAVESAARALGMSARDKLTVARAFDRHGIRAGWERALRTDSRVLIDGITDRLARPDVAGDRYVVSNTSPDALSPSVILTGRIGGGKPVRLSEGERWNSVPATDGRRAAWTSFDAAQEHYQVHVRPLDRSSPPELVFDAPSLVDSVAIDGDTIVWDGVGADGEHGVWVKRGSAAPVEVTAEAAVHGFSPSLKGGRLAYERYWTEDGALRSAPAVLDLRTGAETVIPMPAGSWTARPILTGRHLVWTYDADDDGRYGIMRAAPDGTRRAVVVQDGPQAPGPNWFDANDEVATIGVWPDGSGTGISNAILPKIHQVPLGGGTPQRYSCNRGFQDYFASGEGRTVVWLDGTDGNTDLVTRDRPAPRCRTGS
ncbi:M4 family metallopeptidase [Nonomuraea sp. NPDC049419]|uniref:M4 family metallopeptidase n=1 Tax=Nonomuraea sp. NPDC049419 TaxID=3155772 RepID=UPI0034358A74